MPVRRAGAAAALCTLLAVVAPAFPAQALPVHARALTQCASTTVIGHRGGGTGTENTLGAALSGAAGGAKVFETDLRVTRDGIWVLMHDASIDRTVLGTGLVSQLTYAQVARLRMRDGQPAYVSLSHVLGAYHRAYPANRVELEIKARTTTSRLQGLFRALRTIGLARLTTLTSFSPDQLWAVRRAGGTGYPLALLSQQVVPLSRAVRYSRVIVSVGASGLTGDYVAALAARHRTVGVYDVRHSYAAWSRMVSLGVGAYTTGGAAQVVSWCTDAQLVQTAPAPGPTTPPVTAPTPVPTPVPTPAPSTSP